MNIPACNWRTTTILTGLAVFLCAGMMSAPPRALAEGWPDLSKPARSVGGGKGDAAVVVGIEDYAFVPDVPGTENNTLAWYNYLTRTRKVKPENVVLLRDSDGTLEEMREAAKNAAGFARKGGTLWFIFVGHGAPSKDGKDGLLIGVDAQQKAATLQTRSLRRGELLKILGKTRASAVHVVIDACFSGRSPEGAPLASGLQPLVTTVLAPLSDPRFTVLTAAKGDQFAGALPGGFRPAFSYLVLGGLRGWADQNGDGKLTAGELLGYAKRALQATLRGRNQTPTLMGDANALVAPSARENAPDLAAMATLSPRPGAGGEMFRISKLPGVPRVRMPQAFKRAAPVGQDWRGVDVDVLEKYDAAVKFDKGKASGREKALRWRQLATEAPGLASEAAGRAKEWERFAREQAAAARARLKRNAARDKDWKKLGRLLALEVVPAQDKMRWTGMFVKAYGSSPKDNPYMKTLYKYVAPVKWVTIPGGTFMMGSKSGDKDEKPVHRVTVKTFQMAKTEVTFGQYKACVKAGACTPGKWDGLSASFKGNDHPVVCVDSNQVKAFSKWVGGRLPTEAEWEYAARSAGKDRDYPWGNEKAICDRAVMDDGGEGCGKTATWPVCSKLKGNTDQGLCDMAGNVWEWVEDWYHDSYRGAPKDGSAWVSPTSSFRVIRGGSWSGEAGYVRAASRLGPGSRINRYLGFRPARSP